MKRLLGLGGGIPLLNAAFATRTGWAEAVPQRPVGVEAERAFMARAVEMRRLAVASGDQAYGAVVVKDGRIVGEGPSRVIADQDPTAHAEVVAIRDAAKRLGTRDLSGCVLYGTSKPCRMCETAAHWATIARLVYGPALTDGGSPTYTTC